jgi:hypothetical protein
LSNYDNADADEAGDADESDAKQPVFKLPKGYENEADFLREMRKLYSDDLTADKDNRDAGVEDMAFLVGKQWAEDVEQRRITAKKPVLTVNRIPAFVAQVIGNRRQNEAAIKVIPDNGGTKGVAKIREGLMRSIQKISRAKLAYDKACEGSVVCGLGNFQVCVDWDPDDVFAQSIQIEAINDHFSVVWDRTLTEPTGRDAGHVFVGDSMPIEEFQREYPWATPANIETDIVQQARASGWITSTDVRIVSYWRMRSHKRTLAMMLNNEVRDVTDELKDTAQAAKTLAQIAQGPDGAPVMREVNRKYAQMYLCSGTNILEGPYELPISRVPVFRVPGWDIAVGDEKHRWGLVRFLKDPQRLHNFWRSVLAEKLMQSPRAVWTAADTAVQGREKEWRESHNSDNSLLIWNAESGQKPERVPPAIVEDALLAQAELTTQDLKDVSNIHEANLGMPSNEVSGKGIMARQRVSETGAVLYHDNLNMAIEEAGITINELIPIVYDTQRIIKVIGVDGKEDMVAINQVGNKESDITAGKYSVTVITGPDTATKRIEAAESMMALATAMPQVMGVAADLIVEAQDWPMADKIAERIRSTLPPGLVSQEDMTPEQRQNAAAQSQAADQQNQLAMKTAVAEYFKTMSEAEVNAARAQHFTAQAEAVPAKVQNESVNTASEAAKRELEGHLETIRVATGT